MDLRNLGKSQWDQELGKIEFITACGNTYLICEEEAPTTAVCGLPSSHNATGKNRYPVPLFSEMLVRTSRIPITSSESRKATRTKWRFVHSTGSSNTESCRSGWRMHQLPYYDATTPMRGDKLSAEQRRLKRGMTLPEVPEWRQSPLNDGEVQRHPESGDTCTQRAGICVPEESIYAPSFRKMISPPREFRAKAQSERQWEKTKWSPKMWKASRNTNLVEARTKSKYHAG